MTTASDSPPLVDERRQPQDAVRVAGERHVDARGKTLLRHMQLLSRRRELLMTLAARDLKVRYKQSILGVAWAVAQPFAMMIVFTIVFSHFVHVKTGGIPYPIFSYVALVPWTFFASGLVLGTNSLVGNANLVSKIYFPREIFPIAAILAAFVDFAVASTIFAGMMLYYHTGVSVQILWLPVIVALQLAFMIGLSLSLSAGNVFFRDVRLFLPFALQIWIYLTPVIYPLTTIPGRYRPWFNLNPMTGIIDAYRRTLVEGQAPEPAAFGIAALISLVILAMGYRVFKSAEMQFADVI